MSARHVLAGREGWLFLAEGSNSSISQMTGRLPVPPRTKNAWIHALRIREEAFGERTLTVICPEKSAAYPEELPDGYQISEERFARELERTVDSVFYAMPPAGMSSRYYLKTDTHWTDFGSYDSARSICERLAIDSFDVPDRWTTRQQAGDLGNALSPTQRSINWILEDPPEIATQENGLRNRGRVMRLTRATRRARLLIFGDSFSGISLARQLAYRVGDVTFVHSLSFDYELVDRLSPDFVIGEVAERFLIEPISDGRSIAALIAEKFQQNAFSDEMIERFVASQPFFDEVYGPSLKWLLPSLVGRQVLGQN